MCVAVGVAVVRVSVNDLGYGGLTAAVDRGTVGDLDLDRSVVDAEVVAELMVQAFQDGFGYKPRTTEGTSNEDICSHFIRNYKRSNFYEQIQNSAFPNS